MKGEAIGRTVDVVFGDTLGQRQKGKLIMRFQACHFAMLFLSDPQVGCDDHDGPSGLDDVVVSHPSRRLEVPFVIRAELRAGNISRARG